MQIASLSVGRKIMMITFGLPSEFNEIKLETRN